MRSQCELSGVGVVVLALLVGEPMHPYQAFQTLEKRHETDLVKVNVGAVYHTMEKLAHDGLVRTVAVERNGRRPKRTTYAITETGRQTLTRQVRLFLTADLPSYPLFIVGLAQAHLLAGEEVATLLRTRRDRRAADLAAGRDELTRLRATGLARRYLIESEYQAHQAAAEIEWIDEVLADLVSGAMDWTDQSVPPAEPADLLDPVTR